MRDKQTPQRGRSHSHNSTQSQTPIPWSWRRRVESPVNLEAPSKDVVSHKKVRSSTQGKSNRIVGSRPLLDWAPSENRWRICRFHKVHTCHSSVQYLRVLGFATGVKSCCSAVVFALPSPLAELLCFKTLILELGWPAEVLLERFGVFWCG